MHVVHFRSLVSLIVVAFLSSCASEQKVTVKKAKATSGLDKFNSNYDYEKDENGLMRATSDQQSQFSKKQEFGGSKDFSGKDYTKKDYRKKRWGSKKDYASQAYQGKTKSRYQEEPFYVKKQSQSSEQQSRFGQSSYGTNSFGGVTRAREGGQVSNNVKRGSSSYVKSRSNYPEPLIMSKKDYSKVNQGKLTVSETNSMLGR